MNSYELINRHYPKAYKINMICKGFPMVDSHPIDIEKIFSI